MLVPVGSGVREVEDLAGQARLHLARLHHRSACCARCPPGWTCQTLPGIPDCVVELQHGRVAAVSSDDVLLAGLAAQDPQTEVVGRSLAAVVLRGRDAAATRPDLVRFVNGVLERARADGSLAASDERWLALGPCRDPRAR